MTNYWDDIAGEYQRQTRIRCDDFHFGPLLPGDSRLGLLPANLSGLTCLELGCGAAQNSICLAKRGAACTAVDTSSRQLSRAEILAVENRVGLDLRVMDMEDLPPDWAGRFDLVHSAYALPFADDQGAVIQAAARCLAPKGTLLLSTAHPLFAFEWADFDDGETALLVEDYYSPPPDERISDNGAETACRPVAVSCLTEYFHAAGLVVERLLEPRPLPLDAMTAEDIESKVPYYSPAWHELYPLMCRVPAVLIVKAHPA